MIKKIHFAAVVAAFAIIGCAEGQIDVLSQNEESDEIVELTVNITDDLTKTTGQEYLDNIVNDVQIFVFNRYGVYETSATGEGRSVTFSCTRGHKQIVALVNAEPETDVKNIDDLKGRTSDLANVGKGELVMVGSTEADLPESSPVSIKVARLASMVVLKSVYLDFALAQHRQLSFEISSVYMINVAGDKAYMKDNEPSIWYNKGLCDPGTTLAHLYDSVEDGTLISQGLKYETNHYFYCYPNDTATKTRLVIEALIDGNKYYYPITLDKLQSNNMYSYDVTITRLGSDSPDVPVEEAAVTYTVSLESWTLSQGSKQI